MKPQLRAKLFNAIAEAWNKGVAPGAYVGGSSEAVRVWNSTYTYAKIAEPGRQESYYENQADLAVSRWAVTNGLDLPRSLRG